LGYSADSSKFNEMNDKLIDGLIWYCALVVIVTVHEFGHALAADKCGDGTPRAHGRITLNPIAHIDPIGTVAIPMVIILLQAMDSSMSGFIIGWGRPVIIYPSNLKNPNRDQLLVSLAGPLMNLILAFIMALGMKLALMADSEILFDSLSNVMWISLILMYLNLLPIPPLDGSSILKFFTRMSDETYLNFSRYGIIILIVALQIPFVSSFIYGATLMTLKGFAELLQIGGFQN